MGEAIMVLGLEPRIQQKDLYSTVYCPSVDVPRPVDFRVRCRYERGRGVGKFFLIVNDEQREFYPIRKKGNPDIFHRKSRQFMTTLGGILIPNYDAREDESVKRLTHKLCGFRISKQFSARQTATFLRKYLQEVRNGMGDAKEIKSGKVFLSRPDVEYLVEAVCYQNVEWPIGMILGSR